MNNMGFDGFSLKLPYYRTTDPNFRTTQKYSNFTDKIEEFAAELDLFETQFVKSCPNTDTSLNRNLLEFLQDSYEQFKQNVKTYESNPTLQNEDAVENKRDEYNLIVEQIQKIWNKQ